VALVSTDISEENIASIIRVTRTGELGKALAVTSNPSIPRRNTISVLTGATWHYIPEDSILQATNTFVIAFFYWHRYHYMFQPFWAIVQDYVTY
jgi:hypothetical protein